MEFWIGIIFDTICLAIALFMAINPKGFARGMKYQSVRQTKIFRIVGIIAVIILLISLTSRVRHWYKKMKRVIVYFKRETVLCVAVFLAVYFYVFCQTGSSLCRVY